EDSKVYLRQLELYGGKANVPGVELRQWFDGLWHGRSLAFTVAVLAALVAAGFRLAAIPLPPLDDGDAAGGRQPSRDRDAPRPAAPLAPRHAKALWHGHSVRVAPPLHLLSVCAHSEQLPATVNNLKQGAT